MRKLSLVRSAYISLWCERVQPWMVFVGLFLLGLCLIFAALFFITGADAMRLAALWLFVASVASILFAMSVWFVYYKVLDLITE